MMTGDRRTDPDWLSRLRVVVNGRGFRGEGDYVDVSGWCHRTGHWYCRASQDHSGCAKHKDCGGYDSSADAHNSSMTFPEVRARVARQGHRPYRRIFVLPR